MDILTLDFQRSNKKSSDTALLTLGNSSAHTPWKTTNVRVPWDKVPDKVLNGGNFFFTINPDPDVEWYTKDNDKKTIVTKFLTLFHKLKNQDIIKKSVSVYEYGKYGAKHGKIHFHGFISTTDKKAFEKAVYEVFNERANSRHRTLNLKIIKTTKDRQNMQAYLKKETHNKIKCLYYE